MPRRVASVLFPTLLISTAMIILAGAGGLTNPSDSMPHQGDIEKRLDDMKAAFDKLSEEKDKLADQFRTLSKEHSALKSRYETTAADVTVRIKKLEECESCDRLASLETSRTDHSNRLGAIETKTNFLYVTPTGPEETSLAVTMGKKKFVFQGDGNAVVIGEKGASIWHTGTWQQGR